MNGMKIEEVAMRLGVSVQTINRWYKFKKDNPKDAISKALPAYRKVKMNTAQGFIRIWTEDDFWQLVSFRKLVNSGRTGKMGKYKGKGTKNGKSKSRKTVNA